LYGDSGIIIDTKSACSAAETMMQPSGKTGCLTRPAFHDSVNRRQRRSDKHAALFVHALETGRIVSVQSVAFRLVFGYPSSPGCFDIVQEVLFMHEQEFFNCGAAWFYNILFG